MIKSDPFILMQSDVITNVDLSEVLALHEVRKKRDNSAIMTVLLSDVGDGGILLVLVLVLVVGLGLNVTIPTRHHMRKRRRGTFFHPYEDPPMIYYWHSIHLGEKMKPVSYCGTIIHPNPIRPYPHPSLWKTPPISH